MSGSASLARISERRVRVTVNHLRGGFHAVRQEHLGARNLSIALAACDSYDSAGPGRPIEEPLRVIEASGDLAAALADFRTTVGDPAHGGGVGPQPAGRREIRWDGVPVEQTNTDAFPADFFKGAGLISTTDGIGTR
jgi:hypothetical protein